MIVILGAYAAIAIQMPLPFVMIGRMMMEWLIYKFNSSYGSQLKLLMSMLAILVAIANFAI